jgi:predicted double-glycine peptidase
MTDPSLLTVSFSSMTLESIKQQVTNMMNSPSAKDKMVKIADRRKPVNQPPPLSRPQKLPPWKMGAGNTSSVMNGDINNVSFHDNLSD